MVDPGQQFTCLVPRQWSLGQNLGDSECNGGCREEPSGWTWKTSGGLMNNGRKVTWSE
jgi:hypothetical protein